MLITEHVRAHLCDHLSGHRQGSSTVLIAPKHGGDSIAWSVKRLAAGCAARLQHISSSC